MMMLARLFVVFFKIGLLGFGGGIAIVALIFDSIQQFGTISAAQFADIVAIAQVTPGPVAVNTATYVGFEHAGLAGAAAATLGVAVPAFVLVSIVARMMEKYKSSPAVRGALSAVRPATVGMIATAFITLAKPALLGESRIGASLLGSAVTGLPFDAVAAAICIATILLIGRYKKNPFIVLIAMGCIGALLGV